MRQGTEVGGTPDAASRQGVHDATMATNQTIDRETHADAGVTRAADPDLLAAFMAGFAEDLAATMHLATVVVGDRLGLYRALADRGPIGADELAAAAGCHPRLVLEWARAQVASGYCEHDAGRFWLTPEQAACLADPTSPTYVPGGALAASSNHRDIDRLCQAFLGDGGIGWGDHHHDLFEGTQRFFEPVYRANLVSNWIPALEGVELVLREGGLVADVGCGQGVVLLLMAEAFPQSRFVGFDVHEGSIAAARAAAVEAGVDDRVTFEVAGAEELPGHGYDLICMFNALHEMGDPVGAARRVRTALGPDGVWMFTEPRTDGSLVQSVRARTFYSASTFVCTPSALSQPGGESLGAQAGEDELHRVVSAAGFRNLRVATETPNFMVLEARP